MKNEFSKRIVYPYTLTNLTSDHLDQLEYLDHLHHLDHLVHMDHRDYLGSPVYTSTAQ